LNKNKVWRSSTGKKQEARRVNLPHLSGGLFALRWAPLSKRGVPKLLRNPPAWPRGRRLRNQEVTHEDRRGKSRQLKASNITTRVNQPIPAAGLTPARQAALWAANRILQTFRAADGEDEFSRLGRAIQPERQRRQIAGLNIGRIKYRFVGNTSGNTPVLGLLPYRDQMPTLIKLRGCRGSVS
jgi:hypothetical protein